MSKAVRIVYEEDGFPRELLTAADRARAVRSDSLTPEMNVTVYLDSEKPFVTAAHNIPELRPLFGIDEPDSEVTADDGVNDNAIALAAGTGEDTQSDEMLGFGQDAPGGAPASVPGSVRKRIFQAPGAEPERPTRLTTTPDDGAERSFLGWSLQPLKRYADFEGRALVREYFGFTLFSFLASMLGAGMLGSAWVIVPILLFLPALSVTVRRLHDHNLSGWVVLFGLIPYIGALLLFLVLLVPASTAANRFGASPLSG